MGLRSVWRLTRDEITTVRDAARTGGRRAALVARARHRLLLDDVDAQRILALESRVAELDSRLSDRESDAARQSADRADLAAVVEKLARAEVSVEQGLGAVLRQGAVSAFQARIGPVTTWVRTVELASAPTVSVVLPTRDRSRLLERAVDSVLAQEYRTWELVVVDDGSTDGTPALLERLASVDDRIVVVRTGGAGVGAARNAGLAAATGPIVCYLDDDNAMEPLWLKAVAWAFGQDPGLEVLYGARVAESDHGDGSSDPLPYLHFEPFDRERLEAGNFIDLGVLAHLRELPEAYFDESLRSLVDWDLVLRLTAERAPLTLPVVASIYTTSAPDRLSRTQSYAASESAVRVRMLRDRPLRVLAYNSLFPLVPETYIADEMKALTDNGYVLAWCTHRRLPSPVDVREPTYADLDAAVAGFEPDLLFLFWATFASEQFDELDRIGLPFAVRVHSFDSEPGLVERVRDHPLCVGVWAYPHHARQVPGVRELVPLLTDTERFPQAEPERTIVLSASAGLPKKNWPFLVEAFAELARKGVDCRIIIGLTYRHEDEPDRILDLIEASGSSVQLSVDVPHDQVIDLLGRTALVVYSGTLRERFGMPRSIVEGMYAGTSVLLPNRWESRSVAGPDCRTYERPDDIVRHALEVLAGGPEIEEERAANRRLAEIRYADPALATAFAVQLAGALSAWRCR